MVTEIRGRQVGGYHPVFFADVVHDHRMQPRQQRRNNEADAFARAGRCASEYVLGAIVPQVVTVNLTEHDAGVRGQAGLVDFARQRPACGAVGGDVLGEPSPPDGKSDGCRGAEQTAQTGNEAAAIEDGWRIRIEPVPPRE